MLINNVLLNVLKKNLDDVPNFWRGFCFIPFVPRYVALTLVSNINKYKFIVNS